MAFKMISRVHNNLSSSAPLNTLFKSVTHVIFDLDGTLLDTEKVYKHVFASIGKSYGKQYTTEIMAKVVGTVETESARIAVNEMKLPMQPQQFLTQFRSMTKLIFSNAPVPLIEGAENLVKHLHRKGIPIAVATSSNEDSYKIKIKHHKELFSLFSHVVTGGSDPEVKNGKPHPDIFLLCAARFRDSPNPKKCLVFEDAPNGVTAAVRAGMQVVVIPDKNLPSNLCDHATMTIKSLKDVQLELFGLPKLDSTCN